MAQRIVHYLLACRLAEHCRVTDRQRFLLGSILPDACVSVEDREKAHFRTAEGGLRLYDFNRFRTLFTERILSDDLYLGYYLHLIEDALYRVFLWRGNYDRPAAPEQAAEIHRDYRILNAYFRKTYSLHNELTSLPPIDAEPVLQIASFDCDRLLNDLQSDFMCSETGRLRYVNETMLERYIADAFPVCLQEMRSVRGGSFLLDAQDFKYTLNR